MNCESLDQRGEHHEMPLPLADAMGPTLDDIENAGTRVGTPGRQRAEIPPALRRLVFMRDEFTCQWCGNRLPPRSVSRLMQADDIEVFQLDHIVPHAGGGCDHAHNLRVLCQPCNERRSNFATDQHARALPVTDQCTPCRQSRIQRIADAEDWDCDLPEPSRKPRHTAYCGTCRLVSWVDDEGLLL